MRKNNRWLLVGSMCVLSTLLFHGCSKPRDWSDWEDGAFYGFMAAQKGATYSDYLLKAHEIQKYADEKRKAQKKSLAKYR